MTAVLGIDPAWSATKPSGVALIRQLPDCEWECVSVAPSYDSFLQLAGKIPVNWNAVPAGGLPQPQQLLEAAGTLLHGEGVTVVAIDIPVSNQLIIEQRRPCDDDISHKFGGALCGTHSPNRNRPGELSANLMADLNRLGYNLAACIDDADDDGPPNNATIEVYPHPAIVRLLDLKVRLEYKVDKSNSFWPGITLAERRERLRDNFRRLCTGLATQMRAIPEECIPNDAYLDSRRSLKRFEDALDALVCAWVGACYLGGRAECFGDRQAAIWVPAEGHLPNCQGRRESVPVGG